MDLDLVLKLHLLGFHGFEPDEKPNLTSLKGFSQGPIVGLGRV
jgi:hypothetical protein